jgi:cytoskeletal protein CcmA (bactofilin family)
MFSKQTKGQSRGPAKIEPLPTTAVAAVDPTRKATPKVASLISADITIEGNITGEGELQVDGIVRGDIRVGRLTVGETGHVEGSVYAEASEIRGRVVGAVISKQVRLYGTSYIDGDITHEQLAMETGAFFQGRSLKFQRPAPQPAAAPILAAPSPVPQPKPAQA